MHPDGLAPHIVVVNHAEEILELMQSLLEEEGYRVTTMLRHGQNVETIAATDADLIILDYMWPGSDNEWTMLNLLTIDRRTRDMPVIVCTTAARQVRDMEDHLSTIGVRVVLKPFDIDHLLSVIREALSAPRGETRITTPVPEL